MRFAPRTTALLAFAVLLSPLRGGDFESWVSRLEARNVRVSAGIWDLETGRSLDVHQENLALVPASTTKVVATYAMLKTWSPEFTLGTEVYGTLKNGVVQSDLTLKGGGDPFLVTERIYLMAQGLKELGVTQIQGRIRLDQSAFDSQRYGNGWGNTSSDTTPPILPLSVNCNRDAKGRIAHDPERLALDLFNQVFTECGITILNQGGKQASSEKLMTMPSRPLRDLIQDANKYSNNFIVEMLVKQFGGGSWPKGVARIQEFYQNRANLGPDKVCITDGSGLSKDNRLSARTLAIILQTAMKDFQVGPEMVASLKIIGGEPWQLRVKDPNLTKRVRCKTGHLNDVNCLCGFIQMPDAKIRVFAILLNGKVTDEDVWEQVSRWAN